MNLPVVDGSVEDLVNNNISGQMEAGPPSHDISEQNCKSTANKIISATMDESDSLHFTTEHIGTSTADQIKDCSNYNSEENTDSGTPIMESYMNEIASQSVKTREITRAENTRKLEDILGHKSDSIVNNSGCSSESESKTKTKSNKSALSKRERLKPTLSPTRKEMVQPDLSPAVADSILTAGGEERFSPPSDIVNGYMLPRRPRSGAMSVSEDVDRGMSHVL